MTWHAGKRSRSSNWFVCLPQDVSKYSDNVQIENEVREKSYAIKSIRLASKQLPCGLGRSMGVVKSDGLSMDGDFFFSFPCHLHLSPRWKKSMRVRPPIN